MSWLQGIWRDRLGARARAGALFTQDLGVSEAGPRLALPRKARVGDTGCLCRGREPLREERIWEHKSNEV